MLTEALPIIVPFFGATLLFTCCASCCVWRRARHQYNALADRVQALDARLISYTSSAPVLPLPAPVQAPVPPAMYAMPYTMRGPMQPQGIFYPAHMPRPSAPPAISENPTSIRI